MAKTIAGITFSDYPVFLAPMEDVTDPVFRWLCKQYGVDFMFTEFISADGIIHGAKKGLEKLNISNNERPVAIQLYGKNLNALVGAAKIAEQSNPDVIDLNFGCPVKKIATKGAGAGMLRNLPLLYEITEKVAAAVKIPVTVKTRLGWDYKSIVINEIAEKIQNIGAQALTVHARTRVQMYKGVAEWAHIKTLVDNEKINIPIIGNGDIDSAIKAKEAFEKYKVDAIMIGRASIGRPWIFKEIKHYLTTGEILPEPSIKEKVNVAKIHFEKSLDEKFLRRAIVQMRRHYVNYFKGVPGIKPLRIKILQAETPEEVLKTLDEISYNFGDYIVDRSKFTD